MGEEAIIYFTFVYRTTLLGLLLEPLFIYYALISSIVVAVKIVTVSRCKRKVVNAIHRHWHSLGMLHNEHILDLFIILARGLKHAIRCAEPFFAPPLVSIPSHRLSPCEKLYASSFFLLVIFLWNHVNRLGVSHLRIRHYTLKSRFSCDSSRMILRLVLKSTISIMRAFVVLELARNGSRKWINVSFFSLFLPKLIN